MRPSPTLWALVLGACSQGTPALVVPVLPDGASLDPAVLGLLEERLDEIRARPEDGGARGALGLAFEANELWSEAAASFSDAARLQPDEPHWNYHRAIVLEAGGHHLEALSLLREVARALPDAPHVAQRLGETALAAGALEEARAAFRRTIALAPTQAEGHTGLGACELTAGEPEKAVATLQRALTLDPSYKCAHYRLGLAYRALGRLPEAERELALGLLGRVRYLPDPFADRLRHDSVSAGARLRFALELLESNRPERAARVLEGLRKRNPADVIVLNDLAIARQRMGDMAGARAHLEEAVKLEPRTASTWINLAHLALAENTSARALECAEQALAIAPESAKAELVYGQVLLAQGRRREALAAFEGARSSDPREFEALYLAAQTWLAEQGLEEAQAGFAALALERPFDVRAPVGLAEVALARGERAAAADALARARALDPHHPEVVALGRKLELP